MHRCERTITIIMIMPCHNVDPAPEITAARPLRCGDLHKTRPPTYVPPSSYSNRKHAMTAYTPVLDGTRSQTTICQPICPSPAPSRASVPV